MPLNQGAIGKPGGRIASSDIQTRGVGGPVNPPGSFHYPPPAPPPPADPNNVLGLRGQGIVRALTPETIAARFPGTLQINVASINGNSTPGAGYQCWDFDRPTMLVPIDVPGGILRYTPIKPPVGMSASGADADQFTLRSVGPGVCYFSSAGRWYVKYSGGGVLRFMLIACEDPGMASRLLSLPGNVTGTDPTTGHLTGAAGTTTAIPANINRKSLTIQNNSAGGVIMRVGLGAAPDVSAPPPAGSGLRLQSGGSSITFADSTLYLNPVYVGSDAAWACDYVEIQ